MPTTENGTSRQRVTRVLILIDDWLQECARDARSKNPDSRNGVATEINAHLLAAFKADPRNKSKLKLLPKEYQ